MKRRYALVVRSRSHEWVFDVWAEPQHVNAWREDGLRVDRVLNEIPAWVVMLGLVDVWCFLEDLFYMQIGGD